MGKVGHYIAYRISLTCGHQEKNRKCEHGLAPCLYEPPLSLIKEDLPASQYHV